jgi:hypothetical protein
VEDLDGSKLFDSMLNDDPESSKLSALPGVEDITSVYPFKFH